MSKSSIQSCFLTDLLGELTALSKDLPKQGPKVESLDGEVLGIIIDDLTKAAYFLLMRIKGDEAKNLRLAELALETQQVETGTPFEHESAELRARRYAHTLRKQTVEALLWAGVKGQVASLLGNSEGSIALGAGWEIIMLTSEREDGGLGDMPLFLTGSRRRPRRE